MTGVPKSTIGRVMCLEDKLREEWAVRGERGKSQKRKRAGKNPKIEEALIQWHSSATGEGERINGPMLISKPEELAKQLGFADFKATDGWLSRWKTRHQIRFKKVSEVKSATSEDSIEEVDAPQKFSSGDTSNIEAVNLLYYLPPDCSLSFDVGTCKNSFKF